MTLKDHLLMWVVLLVTGGVFAGSVSLTERVGALRAVTVSPGIAAHWQVPVQFLGEDFHLRLCQEPPAIDASDEGLVTLHAWAGDVVELQPAYIAGPPSLTYEIDTVSVASYGSLKPPDMTLRLHVRLGDANADAPASVDLEFHGCAAIPAAYWEGQEEEAARTLARAVEKGDPATILRAEAFVDELAERQDLFAQAHRVEGTAHFEIQSRSGSRAFLLTAGYYVLIGLVIISGLIFGFCLLSAILRLKAE